MAAAAPAGARVAPRRRPSAAPRRRPRAAPRNRRRASARSRPRAQSRGATPAAGVAQLTAVAVGRTAVAVGDIADSGLMVRLTRGRLWIAVLAALLAGIVALNVFSLSFSSSSSRIAERSESVAQENSVLRARLAKQLSSKRVEALAASLGLEVPEPKDIVYLSPDDTDPKVAARRLQSGELGTPPDLAASPTSATNALPAP
jgi:hypothetical protein